MERLFWALIQFILWAERMHESSLPDLALRYFKRRGYKIERGVHHEGFSGLLRNFDLLVQKGNEHHPVWIKDWNRTVGINIVINIDKAASDVGYSSPILIAEKFSDHAKAYANRKGIKLITKSEIKMDLR